MFGKKRVYLDTAAAAPTLPAARRAFLHALEDFGNPSSPHLEGRAATQVLERARATIARLAEVKPEAVIFTGGASEANAIGIRGHLEALGRAKSTLHMLYASGAHSSVIGTLESLAKEGVQIEPLTVTDGAMDLGVLAARIRPETVLVCVDVVCGETGMMPDVRDIRRTLDAVRPGIRLFVDASQAPRVRSYALNHLGADLLTLDAQKVGGVRGVGALIAPRHVPLLGLTQGGGQERGLRPGTEATALISAFAAALTEADKSREAFIARARSAREALISYVRKEVPDALVNEGREQAPHILNFSFPGRDTDYLVALLDEAGYAVSTRSACETDSENGSRAVLALTSDFERARATLRISWGPETRVSDLARFSVALVRAIRFLDRNRL